MSDRMDKPLFIEGLLEAAGRVAWAMGVEPVGV
jgi:hypothetical protein